MDGDGHTATGVDSASVTLQTFDDYLDLSKFLTSGYLTVIALFFFYSLSVVHNGLRSGELLIYKIAWFTYVEFGCELRLKLDRQKICAQTSEYQTNKW